MSNEMGVEYGGAEEGMCPFYRRKIKSPAWFRCVSPKHANQNYEFCGDGAHAGQFQYCSNCGRNGRKVCKYYFEPVQVQEPAQVRVPAPDRQSAPVGVSAPDRQPAPDREPARQVPRDAGGRSQAGTASVSGGRASSRYSFGGDRNQHMCQYWRRDEEQEKAYHCDSDGNPEGPSYKFPTTGLTDSVKRFRENCRKAENGVPPCCEYFPGGGFKSGDSESGGSEEKEGSGELMKELMEAAVKTAFDPPSGIIEAVEVVGTLLKDTNG
ncbi:MAG: hypothetical protein HFG70_03800 [Hungatella sp.]|nr:hypothetical protein [Hungatella sp.]